MMILATENDVDRLYSILEDCSAWLKNKGIQQWNPVYPKKLFLKNIQSGEVFYFTNNNELIGTATLYKEKPFYYPSDIWNDNLNVWYLCRFAVPRHLKNKQAGSKIFSEIENKAKKCAIKRIRLDIVKSNPFLEGYYTNLGFQRIGEVLLRETPSILMEKVI